MSTNNSDDNFERVRFHRETLIQKHGFMVQGVFGTDKAPEPPFAYTIGLHQKNRPEIIVFGLPPETAHQLLNTVARLLLDRETALPKIREKLTLPGWGVPAYLVSVPAVRAELYAYGAATRSQQQATYFQVVWPDKAGLFPWEPGADFSSFPQQYLGQPQA